MHWYHSSLQLVITFNCSPLVSVEIKHDRSIIALVPHMHFFTHILFVLHCGLNADPKGCNSATVLIIQQH